MAANALIFDLDGTVWDSAAWFAAALGEDDPDAVAAARSDLVAGGNIVRVLNRAGISRVRLLNEAQRRCGPPPLFNGVVETLKALEQRGTPIAVATSLPGSLALPMVKAAGLAETFGAIVHAGICRVPKPNPASINMALRLLGVPASLNVFYVGDRAIDAEAARRAGVSSAWIAHGYEHPDHGLGIVPIVPAELLDL